LIVQKQFVTDYIQCPYLYARNSLSSRANAIKLSDMHTNIKKHLVEIASYEMKNLVKLKASEYRTKFTNKYYRKPSQVLKLESIIKDLNTLFEVFASNIFVGYNVPVEIPIQGTSTEYRDFIDFILMDPEKDIIIVQIDDLSNLEEYKNRMKSWVHYTAAYSFLAAQFGKTVSVTVVDPVTLFRFDTKFSPERFDSDYEQLNSLMLPVANNVIYKNLFACNYCESKEDCR